MGEGVRHVLAVLRLREHHHDGAAVARVQHQQQVRVPEGEDVLPGALDVLHAHVPHAQRGMKRADEK